MRFASLGSGSKGNALVVSLQGTNILIDCGLPFRQLTAALQRLSLDVSCLQAVFITHEHSDHIKGLRALLRRHQIPLFMTAGTAMAADCMELPQLELIGDHSIVAVGALQVQAVIVPHDAREPCQYVITGRVGQAADSASSERRLGLLTDLGSYSQHVLEAYADCDALILECNHDVEMLNNGSYPPSVKRRVLGDWGHLSNVQARELLSRLNSSNMQWLVLAHISQQNNAEHLVVSEMQTVFPQQQKIRVADQDQGFDWLELV